MARSKKESSSSPEGNMEPPEVNLPVSLLISKDSWDALTMASRRFRTSKSHIADLLFSNLHKLRIVDIIDEPSEANQPQHADDEEEDYENDSETDDEITTDIEDEKRN